MFLHATTCWLAPVVLDQDVDIDVLECLVGLDTLLRVIEN